MNDFQIFNKKYSKLSLHKNDNKKVQMKNIPPIFKDIFHTNSNNFENHSLFGKYNQNTKKNSLDENFNVKNSRSNINSKNLSIPINGVQKNKISINRNKDSSLNIHKNILFKKNVEKYLYNSHKEGNLYSNNSKENSNNDNYKSNVILNKMNNFKLNILTKKPNLNFINIKKNSISFNSNINLGKSVSKSKSKSKSKNKKENKSHNNKLNNNINKIILDKYIKIYKIGEKEFRKKSESKSLNIVGRESSNSNINKMSLSNIISKIQYKGLNKKNKSSNLLISNVNKQKNIHNSKTSSNIVITKIEQNNNSKMKNNNIKLINNDKNVNNNENINSKKYLSKNHIMYLDKKSSGIKKEKNMKKRKKEKHLSFNNLKNDIENVNSNINGSNYLNTNYNESKNKGSENIIYDYKSNNNLLFKNNNLYRNSKLNILNDESNILNERLKTEYNKSLENKYDINKTSLSFNENDSLRLYPEIYIKDDEYNYDKEKNIKREKELDETESPLKMDTDQVSNENSGVLSFDQVKDIICYHNMNNIDKKYDFLFRKNEREIYDINIKSKYLNFFFPNTNNKEIQGKGNDNNDISDDFVPFQTKINFKYPNSSIFSIDTEYSSKMKKKYNKNLVENS